MFSRWHKYALVKSSWFVWRWLIFNSHFINKFQWNLNKIRRKAKICIFSCVTSCVIFHGGLPFFMAQCHFSWLSVLTWIINGIADGAIKSHYSDVIMSTMASKTTSLTTVYSWYEHTFRIIDRLWGDPSVTGGFPSQRPVTRSICLMLKWTSCWPNNWFVGDLGLNALMGRYCKGMGYFVLQNHVIFYW